MPCPVVDDRDYRPRRRAGVCVTGSVAVGSQRDGQDTSGHTSGVAPYLVSRADFTGKLREFEKRPDRFFKTEVRKNLRLLPDWLHPIRRRPIP